VAGVDKGLNYLSSIVIGIVVHHDDFIREQITNVLCEGSLQQLTKILTPVIGADQ
jgi:hypothetical protein